MAGVDWGAENETGLRALKIATSVDRHRAVREGSREMTYRVKSRIPMIALPMRLEHQLYPLESAILSNKTPASAKWTRSA